MNGVLRPAGPKDIAFWHAVRNHPTVRSWCRCTLPIKPLEHGKWFRESLRNKERRLYIITTGEYQHVPLGIARLDHRGGWTELSVALLPDARGQGYGRQAVQYLVTETRRLGWPEPRAIVNGANIASLRLFIGLGFTTKTKRWVQLRLPIKKG